MTNVVEEHRFRQLLSQSVNSKVEIVTNFGSITGKVVQIPIFDVPINYVVLKESENNFVYIPLLSINSLIVVQEGDV